jgi:O-6-methylguanine DNA methyltransferase
MGTLTYAELARRAGRLQAARQGGASSNPLPVVVPCHRVVGSDGSPTGYAGGPYLKRHCDLERGRRCNR